MAAAASASVWVTVVRLLCDGRNVRCETVTGRHNKTVSPPHQCHITHLTLSPLARPASHQPASDADIFWLKTAMTGLSSAGCCSYLPVGGGGGGGGGDCCDRTWQGKSKVGGNVHNMTRHRVITAGMWQVIILSSSQQNVEFSSFSAWYLLAECDRGDRLELTG